MIESGFWIFLLEAALAGGLFIGLIWWVMRGPSKAERERFERAQKIQDAGVIRSVEPKDRTDSTQ